MSRARVSSGRHGWLDSTAHAPPLARVVSILYKWAWNDVLYRVASGETVRGHRIVSALGPGPMTFRVAAEPIDDATLERWMRLSDAERTDEAEELLQRSA